MGFNQLVFLFFALLVCEWQFDTVGRTVSQVQGLSNYFYKYPPNMRNFKSCFLKLFRAWWIIQLAENRQSRLPGGEKGGRGKCPAQTRDAYRSHGDAPSSLLYYRHLI